MKNITTFLAGKLIGLTSYRFSKSWRHGETAMKRFVYKYLVDTVEANYIAGLDAYPKY